MGKFLGAVELKARTTNPTLQISEAEELEDHYIVPAEAALEEQLGLDLETSRVPPDDDATDIPTYLHGTFDTYPDEKTKFLADIRRALVIFCESMALNPNRLASQSIQGTSATFGPRLPDDCRLIMRKWLPLSRNPMGGNIMR